jgi:GMP synthase (glutamine-hydrolysing)
MTDSLRSGGIAILDFGSQYTQLIARRVREQGVYAEVFPYDATPEQLNTLSPQGCILSGGPDSVYDEDGLTLSAGILDLDTPLLGICYGMHIIAQSLGGKVELAQTREYGPAHITLSGDSPLFQGLPGELDVWMSHGDHVIQPPPGFATLSQSNHGIVAAIGNNDRRIYAVQFHPEVAHTQHGVNLIRNFVLNVCGCEPKWSADAFIDDAIQRIQAQVGDERVLLGLSGGVDSAVTGALIHKAIGDGLISVFVNTGMLRRDEPTEVIEVFRRQQGMSLIAVDSTELFLDRLQGITEPEEKRRTIGKTFVDVFAEEAARLHWHRARFTRM